MAELAALPPLEILHRRSAKRTRDIFAADSGDILQDDETRFISSFAKLGASSFYAIVVHAFVSP